MKRITLKRIIIMEAIILLMISFASTSFALPVGTYATLQYAYGYQIPASHPTTIVTGVQIWDLGPSPISLGTFDAYGNVSGGDAVLMAYLNMGTAPVNSAGLPGVSGGGMFVTQSSPINSGMTNTNGFTLPVNTNSVAFGVSFPAGTESASIGSEGDLYIGLAFLESADQPLSEALGVTVPYHVRIGETGGFIQQPEGTIFYYTDFSIGGASYFAPVPEPATILLLVTGLIGLVAYRLRYKII